MPARASKYRRRLDRAESAMSKALRGIRGGFQAARTRCGIGGRGGISDLQGRA